MSWSLFQPNVNFVVGLNTYDIPITHMRVNAGPYSREVKEGTAIRSFDGRFYQVHQGWRTRVTFDWPEMTSASQQTLYDFIVDMAATGVCTVVFDPVNGEQTVDMILEDPTQALKAVFRGNARNRPASLSMVSSNILASAPSWITGDAEADSIMWTGDDGMFYITSGDLAVTVNTGLDVSSYLGQNAHNIDFHKLQNRVFAIDSGIVYSWSPDGSGFREEFDTGLGDQEGIHVDSINNRASVTAHEINFANHRYKIYNLATGAQIFDTEFRIGTASYTLTRGQYHHELNRTYFANTAAVIYVQPSPLVLSGLGPISHVAAQDICLDEEGGYVYHLCSPGIYKQLDDVVSGSGDIFVATVPNLSTVIDVYDHAGIRYLVGGGGDSFRVKLDGTGSTTGWHTGSGTTIDQLCTRRPF